MAHVACVQLCEYAAAAGVCFFKRQIRVGCWADGSGGREAGRQRHSVSHRTRGTVDGLAALHGATGQGESPVHEES